MSAPPMRFYPAGPEFPDWAADDDGDEYPSRHRRTTRILVITGVVVAVLLIGAVAFAGSVLFAGDADRTSGADTAAAGNAGGDTGTGADPSDPSQTDLLPTDTAAPTDPAPTNPPAATPTKAAPAPTKTRATTAPPAGSANTSAETRVLQIVNTERAKAGCAPLNADSKLATAARKHSADMAARNYFSHTTPEGVSFATRISNAGYRWSGAAENIAKGQRTPESVMTAWMNSSGHRANILNCKLKDLGVGVAKDSRGALVWTQDFGSPG